MTDSATGNGKFAQELILAKLGEMHADIKEIRAVGNTTSARLDVVEGKVLGLPCAAHRADMAELKDALRNRLGWRALLIALVPAIIAGVMLGWRFL